MTKILSLKLKGEIFDETERVLREIHVPRNAYINSAVRFFNKLNKRSLLKKELARESELARENSMAVLEAFEAFEDELPGT